MNEKMNNKFYINNMHEAWDIDESYNYELYDLLCSEYSSLYPYDITLDQVYDEIMNNYNDEDLANDVIENLESYQEENFYESKDNSHKRVLNESLKVKRNGVKHNFRTITEGLKYFERKEFNENYKDAELESLYEGIKNNLDQEDIRKLGNFLKKADNADEVSTYIKGLLSEDLNKAYTKEEFDEVINKLVNELSTVGFILDDSSSKITNNLMGGKHLQVINPGMFYPTSETEGEEITEDEAFKFFRDDLIEVESVLDQFEEDHKDKLYITFNFGPNKDGVITGGIDVHTWKEII